MTDAEPPPPRDRMRLFADAITLVAMLLVLYGVSLNWDVRADRKVNLAIVLVSLVAVGLSVLGLVRGLRRR